jgi:Fe-S-cluster containining protein
MELQPDGVPPQQGFAEDVARLAWLSLLRDVQRITDLGVTAGIARGVAGGRRLACDRGCASCCRTHTDIPVYPLELMGIAWYVNEKLAQPLRGRVLGQMLDYRSRPACPFLVDEACAIHPVRPMACRHFNVFDRPCAEGEDAYHNRRGDVLNPERAFMDQALERMLEHHGVADPAERRRRVLSGEVHRLAQSLRDLGWDRLAGRLGA